MTAARLGALRVLLALERHQTTLAAELERARPETTDRRDRALLFELAAGTLRWRNELDAVLALHSRRPLGEMAADLRTVLRLGAYQLRHLDRVPSHAVVHESVELIRAIGQPNATGFVNAVLRNLIRAGAKGALPPRPGAGAPRAAQLAYLTTTMSHPEWLAARWLTRYGFDATEAWCTFNNRQPDVTARVLAPGGVTAAIDALRGAGVEAEPAAWIAGALRLPSGAAGRLPPEIAASLFIQDEASQIVAHCVGARPDERVLDACAAPGGKTLVIASQMADRGLLVAADHRPSRVRLLAGVLQRAGAGAAIARLTAMRPLPFGAVFDRVLLDAPCSGLGTMRRDPDLKWTRTEASLATFAASQRTMLANVADALRPGGSILYATCSSEPEENEDVVNAVLAARSDLELARIEPDAAVQHPDRLLDDRGMLRTLPFRDGLDAFFAALLVRRRAA